MGNDVDRKLRRITPIFDLVHSQRHTVQCDRSLGSDHRSEVVGHSDFNSSGIALGFDPDDQELRSEPVSRIASKVSSYASVRDALLQRQRDFAGQEGGAVLDGRDIGTIIAPNADAKLFVTASPEVRAQRRVRELLERGPLCSARGTHGFLARDERDATREFAPLRQAEDADLLDTSELDVDQAIAEAIRLVEARVSVL